MSKRKTILLVISIVLLIVGVIACLGVAFATGFDFDKVGSATYITNEHKLSEDFNKISVETDTADVIFALSEDGEGKVVCYEQENLTHTVEVKNGTLVIKVRDGRKWYQFINISTSSMKVTVHLPKSQYELVKAETDTGKIELHKGLSFDKADLDTDTGEIAVYGDCNTLSAITDTGRVNLKSADIDNANIETDTGKVRIEDIAFATLSIEVDTGDVDLKGVTATVKMRIESDTGDVELDMCDAADIYIKTSTGDVTGTLRTHKTFYHKTSTGDVDLPPSRPGGECRIITSTGDMEIRIAE